MNALKRLRRRVLAGWRRPKPNPEIKAARDAGIPTYVWVLGPEAVEEWQRLERGVRRPRTTS